MVDKDKLRKIKEQLRTHAPDFAKKVAPLYQALDWKWQGSKVPPTEQEILVQLIVMINGFNGHTARLTTGGLSVVHDFEGDAFYLEFSFNGGLIF